MNLTRTPLLLLSLVAPAYGVDSMPCAIEGERIHWIADHCMSTLETDDEIPTMKCITDERRRAFQNDCVAKRHYKRKLCELALSRKTIAGSLDTCLSNEDFVGPTVKNKGVSGRRDR